LSERRQLACQDHEPAVLDLIGIAEQPPRGRAGGESTVSVVSAAVTRAHEELGLREPADRAAQMRAIDREHLEILTLQVPHPTGNVGGLAVPRAHERVMKGGQPRLPLGKLAERSQRNPATVSPATLAAHGRKEVADDRYRQNSRYRAVYQY